MFLTRDEITVLSDLYNFVRTPNTVGDHYVIVGVPSRLYRKLIIGLGPAMSGIILKAHQVTADNSVKEWLDRVQAEFATPEEMAKAAEKVLDPNTRKMLIRRAEKWKRVRDITDADD